MGAVRLTDFGGMIPVRDERLLPGNAAARSENARPLGGNLRGFRPDVAIHTCINPNTKNVFRIPNSPGEKPSVSFGNSTWMEFSSQFVDVLRTPVVDDSYARYYWVSPDDVPKYNTLARIQTGLPSYHLGVPPPSTALQVIASTGIPASLDAGVGVGMCGAVLGADGKSYSIPFNATDIVVIDPATDTATRRAFGADLSGDKKWLGGVRAANGKIYGIPCDATDILVIDPATGTATRSAMGADLTGTSKWAGGALGADGKIYAAPFNSTKVLVIDPVAGTATLAAMGADLSGLSKWIGAVLGTDNKIYGIPYDAQDILVIDPTAGTATRTAMGAAITGSGNWVSGVRAVNNKIYAVPFNATQILVIDPTAGTATVTALGGELSGVAKWADAVVGADGKIYGIPYDALNILVIDPVAAAASRMAVKADLSGQSKWHGAVLGANNKIYCAPYKATDILVIKPADSTADRTVLGATLVGGAKWQCACAGTNGKVYGIPYGAESILIIDPTAGTATSSAMGAADLTGDAKWACAVVSGGKIYGIPYDAEDILVIDPAAGTATRSAMGATLSGNAKWLGAVIGADGKIYGIPYDATDILIIDPVAGTASRSTLGASALTGSSKWVGGVLATDNKIYGIPYDSQDILVVDPAAATDKVTRATLTASLLGSGKWRGGALGSDGKIYAIPHNSADILIIAQVSGVAVASRDTMGGTITGTFNWAGAIVVGGKIYGLPVNANTVFAIDPVAHTASQEKMGADLSGPTKWIGGVLANGKIYGVPYDAVDILVVDTAAVKATRGALGATLVAFVAGDTSNAPVTSVRSYMSTWVTEYGEEGPPGPPIVVTGAEGYVWSLVLKPPTTEENANRDLKKVRIYRTVTSSFGQASFFLVDELDINSVRYIDSVTDDTVSGQTSLASTSWVAPPTDLQGMVAMPNGIFAAWKGNTVYFSEPYRPHAWPAEYALTVDYPIVGLGVFGQTLVVMTSGNPTIITGVTPIAMAQAKIAAFEPCLARASIMSNPEGVYYASPNGLVFISAGVVNNISSSLVDKEMWLNDVDPYGLVAVRYRTGYLALQAPRSGNGDGVLIDQGQVGFNWVNDTRPLQNVQMDPWTGEILLIYDDAGARKVFRFDPADASGMQPFTWKSKLFQLPKKDNLGAAKVAFTVPDGTPAQSATPDNTLEQDLSTDQYALLRVYADGVHVATREVRKSGDMVRLPSGFKAEFWQFEVTSRVIIHSIELAASVKELASV